MPIVDTKITLGIPQADGRIWVTERHTDHTGQEHRVEYLAPPDWNHEEVAQSRAALMGTEIDRREAQLREASNFVIAWTKREFLERLSFQERAAIRELAKTNAIVADFMDFLSMSQDVTPGFGTLMSALYYLEMVGVLAEGRADEIGRVA